ncbi:hypothetical protein EMA8858_01924 [Emticicia aquatica]|uniref:DUF5077 domain-containing protein n=1 Tax=Emticicia aquatica TaxID=1681835 RepID=A0ABN8EXQ6_9BACT|nr:DUF3472 domain-containing protein [Emticicia aquatica]CAH0995797.1 hypothetical protein EMA8858_01924 [Emticicia aquatica]
MKFNYLVFLIICLFSQCKAEKVSKNIPKEHDINKQIIPIGGNAWTSNGGNIDENGFSNWDSKQTICRTYFKVEQTGTIKLSLFLTGNGGKSKILVKILNKSINVEAEGNTEKEQFVGEWNIVKAGYISVDIIGISKTETTFGTISNMAVSGTAISPALSFVKNNEGNFFYWGRRGPSVHLRYETNKNNEIEWFYNEITVPKNNDVIGSYFMANGFGEGYFGMQVNSEKERRILFSVWSPFETDNPETIPQDQKILLLKKGTNVYTGEFGNEGSGGQSYLKYNWKADNTYKFLLQGKPTSDNYTIYSAYFFAPEENKWLLIASFKRPKTSTYLKNLYSFLENFIPETGNQERMGYFDNQWIYDSKNGWKELNQVTFTADNTARKGYRKDYGGGTKNGKFYLRNCGFFSDNTLLNQKFSRPNQNIKPVIDFSKLP